MPGSLVASYRTFPPAGPSWRRARRPFCNAPATRLSRQITVQPLERVRQQQALSLAYFDAFRGSAVLAVLLVALVLLMRCSMAEKGVPIGAEEHKSRSRGHSGHRAPTTCRSAPRARRFCGKFSFGVNLGYDPSR